MKIGNVTIEGKAGLAPMAGVADRVFRQLCKDFGAAYVVSEMVSSKGLSFSDRRTEELMALSPGEHPAAIQLFGDDPAMMAQAAQKALQFGPDVLDINMGCPAPKVNSSGGGASLMKDPALCARITAAVAKAVNIPVTVKIRKGWDESSVNAVEVAKRCEEAGAAAITIHGRTRVQMYAPPVDWDIIAQVKQAVSIPVIGNGDVVEPEDAARLYEHTNCDFIMIGRGACGNPWIFQRVNALLEHGVVLPAPGPAERMRVMCLHLKALCEAKGEAHAMREARKHAAWYMKGLNGAAEFRRRAGMLERYEEAQRLAADVIQMNQSF